MTSIVTVGYRHCFIAGDILQLSSGWILVLEANETAVVVRPYRWYERLWSWIRTSLRRNGEA